MSNYAEQLNVLEATIEAAKAPMEKAEALARLMQNEDFKSVIMQGYLKDFAVDQVRMRSKPECQDDRMQKALERGIDGVGALWGYMDAINAAGNEADRQTRDCQEAIREIEAEESVAEFQE